MRFEFYHSGLDAVPKLAVDGTASNSIHFSHWKGNETPAEVKADTSTEIALNVISSPNRERLTKGIELVTNNHFDTDGVLSVWTMLNGERALDLRDRLIPAAEAGDFSEFTNVDAIRASITIQGSDQPVDDEGSPLAQKLSGGPIDDDARAYDLVLSEVESVLTQTDRYEELWRGPWKQIEAAIESFEKHESLVEEFDEAKASLITISDRLFSPDGFDPVRHSAPFTAISRYARGELFVIALPYQSGWAYRIDYPYYSWAETVVRPAIQRRDLTNVLRQLNEFERNRNGKWAADSSELSSAAKFSHHGRLACSSLSPDRVIEVINANSSISEAAVSR